MGIDMPLPVAEFVSFWSNWLLVGALAFGLLATYGIVVSANVKERFAAARIAANETDTARANESAAQADEHSRTLELSLEKERIERLKLEAKYAPRILTGVQIGELVVALAPLKGESVDVVSYETLGTDVAVLSNQLSAAFVAAGVHATVFTPDPGSGLILGVVVRTEQGASGAPVDLLVSALKAAGLSSRPMNSYLVGQAIAGAFMGPTGVAPTAKLRVLVGAKPEPNPGPVAP